VFTVCKLVRVARGGGGVLPIAGALVLCACSEARADISIAQDSWDRYVKLQADPGVPPPAIVTTSDGMKSLHMVRSGGEKFGIYVVKVTQVPAGKSRFRVRVVARQVADGSNGLGIRNLSIDPDDPASDDSMQVQTSFVSILLSDSDGSSAPRARDDRDLENDADEPNTLGGLSGDRVEDPALSTVTNPAGQLTTVNATLELRLGLNVLRLDATDPRDLPEYDPDPGYQLFSIVLGPSEPELQGVVIGGITIRGTDWENYARVGAEPGIIPPVIVTTEDGHQSFHMHRPSADKFGIYAVRVTQLPPGKTRFPVKVLAREVRDDSNGLGIRNLTIDPDDPNSNRAVEVQKSYVALFLSDDEVSGPRAIDDLGIDDNENTLGGLSGAQVEDPTLSPWTNPAGELTTTNATLELRPGINLIRLDPTDPRSLPAYDPNTGYQLFLLNIGPDETALKGEAVLPCAVSRTVSPNPYFPGDIVSVTLSAANILSPSLIRDVFPAGWTPVSLGGGNVAGNTITFAMEADGERSYTLRAPDACANVNFTGMTSGTYCSGSIAGDSRRLRCGIQFSGGLSGMLFIGPIDVGSAGASCDAGGRFGAGDYLSDGVTGESNLLVGLGDDLDPAFGDAADGLGIKASTNSSLNPRRAQGKLTVWRADADADGRINLQDADNIGSLDHHVTYGLIYLENTTASCLAANLEVSANDAFKVRLNGDLVHVSSGCATVLPPGEGEMIPVALSPGSNVLLIGVLDGTDENDTRIMVRDVDGAPFTDGSIAVSFEPPPAYPDAPPASIDRSIQPRVARPGSAVSVTLSARGLAGATSITDIFPAGWSLLDAGGGLAGVHSIGFNVGADSDVTYVVQVPESFSGSATWRGSFSTAGFTGCKEVEGDEDVLVVGTDFPCTPDPRIRPTLVRAFLFSARQLECPSFNDPAVDFTVVHHSGGDATAADALAYSAARGWGYEVLYPDSGNMPFGPRAGFGRFGPFDETPNIRDKFPDSCPEAIYDSGIGIKDFPQVCNAAATGVPDDPCTAATVLPGGALYVPVGAIFRVDVPNGRYRFVAAVGDSDFPHTHRILAEDGGSGPPAAIGPNHVVLVRNFDQAQYALGETDPEELGEGVYARVGFNCLIPPPGDGVFPSPVFVNMDRDGSQTAGVPESPELVVTSGFIRIHQLQGNSNPGPGSADPSVNGSDLVVLELWQTGPPDGSGGSQLPGDCTQDSRLDISDAVCELLFLFVGGGNPLPCGDSQESDPGNRALLDVNGDGRIDLSDPVVTLNHLFLGGPEPHLGTSCVPMEACPSVCSP